MEYVSSSSSDVILNKPTITYNSTTKNYTINATGGLGATYIEDELPTFLVGPTNGVIKSIGGVDGVAISIRNLKKVDKKNTSTGITIKNGLGQFRNGSSRTSTTMVTNNDDRGVGFEVQDTIKISNVKNFAAYSGSVKLGYSHTWDKTSVSSISLGVDSVSFGWDKSSDKWEAYSYSRTFTKGKQN